MLSTDVHQHLWPPEVLRALERRDAPPCAAWRDGLWLVRLPGEPAFAIDPADHDVASRAQRVRAAGLDRALVALSSPVGIEALGAGEAEPVLAAWNQAAAGLPPELGWWGAVSLAAGDADLIDAADAALDAGAAGVVVAAGALASPAGLERLGPLLERLAERLAPVFVHPGPAPWTQHPAAVDAAWWAPCTAYVAELHAAWHAWAAWGRGSHPQLHVLWAALAGLAPLHAERTALRGGPAGAAQADPLAFYDTSGYGPRARGWMACSVGTGQLVHGTDAPVVAVSDHDHDDDDDDGLRTENVARLLGTAWVAA